MKYKNMKKMIFPKAYKYFQSLGILIEQHKICTQSYIQEKYTD